MNQAKLSKQYDAIISLGAACQVAHHLRRKNLRAFSGPFDWFVMESLGRLTALFRNQFAQFMDLGHLQAEGAHGECLGVRDTVYNCLSVHDFPLSCNAAGQLNSYAQFREKIDRRLARLRDLMHDKTKTILFIRQFGVIPDLASYHELADEFREFHAVLKSTVRARFDILAVTEQVNRQFFTEDWRLDNLALTLIDSPEGEWEGSEEDWDAILAGLALKIPQKSLLGRLRECFRKR